MVGAAAWAAPAIAIAASSPAAAASQPAPPAVPAVQITNKAAIGAGAIAYPHAAPGLKVEATLNGGLPPASDNITVTLPAGLTWAGGSTAPKSFSLAAAGAVTVGGITAVQYQAAGDYIVTVEYRGVTDTVTVPVVKVGFVLAWGANNDGLAGIGGNGTPTTIDNPTQWYVEPLKYGETQFNSIKGSGQGRLFACNTLNSGVYSTIEGAAIKSSIPRFGITDAKSVDVAGYISSTLDVLIYQATDNQVWAQGPNPGDMFSRGETTTHPDFQVIGTEIIKASGKTIERVYAYNTAAAYIMSDKTVWWSGKNTNCMMGSGGDKDETYLAAQVIKEDGTPLTNIVEILCNEYYAIYRDASGNLWASGSNKQSQLPGAPDPDDATAKLYPRAVRIDNPDGKQVSRLLPEGGYVTLTTDGSLWINPAYSGNAWMQIGTVPPGHGTVVNMVRGSVLNSAVLLMSDGTVHTQPTQKLGTDASSWTHFDALPEGASAIASSSPQGKTGTVIALFL